MPSEAPAAAPVERLPTDRNEDLGPGTALCLSGGGYRAMLFHLGAVWRLNEAGLLPTLERVSSVSGGSITAGVLGQSWADLRFDATGVAAAFSELVVQADPDARRHHDRSMVRARRRSRARISQ